MEPAQTPDWQESVCVQALPSLQRVPLAAAGLLHVPVAALQVPAVWQASLAVQVKGRPAVQAPARQVSPTVQALPSLQGVRFCAEGLEQTPVEVLQVPAT